MNVLRSYVLRSGRYNACYKRFSSTYDSSNLPYNLGLYFVPQQEAWVVERFGKFQSILGPGINVKVPLVDRVAYVQNLKEMAIEIPDQSAITIDNVGLHLNGVLYVKVIDSYKASYGVEDPEFAVTQLAQTTMRSEIGKITLDQCLREREALNSKIVNAINEASIPWGINCLRYEIRDVILPDKIRVSMQSQVEADRKKRATILESEGKRQSEVNVAEGKRLSIILASEADKQANINRAVGEAAAVLANAKARAAAIETVSRSIGQQHGMHAVNMALAEQYIAAFSQLAKKSNTLMLPSNTGDVASMVSQAMAVYGSLNQRNPNVGSDEPAAAPEDASSADGSLDDIRRSLDQFIKTDALRSSEDLSTSETDTLQPWK